MHHQTRSRNTPTTMQPQHGSRQARAHRQHLPTQHMQVNKDTSRLQAHRQPQSRRLRQYWRLLWQLQFTNITYHLQQLTTLRQATCNSHRHNSKTLDITNKREHHTARNMRNIRKFTLLQKYHKARRPRAQQRSYTTPSDEDSN